MSDYYCFIAGLPDINIDDNKTTYTVEEFKKELEDVLSSKDKKIIDLFYLQFDNKNLLHMLRSKESSFDDRGVYSEEEMTELIQYAKETDSPSDKRYPAYFFTFIEAFLTDKPLIEGLSWEDQLSSLYYEYAGKVKNKFIAEWYEFNLNINNMLGAIAARKHGINPENAVLGSSEVSDSIRKSGQRDMGLTGTLDYLESVLRISDENDLKEREKRVDVFRWEWLEENTFFHYFSVERIFAYLIKLEIIERWVNLDPESGKSIFRTMIDDLKKQIKTENFDFENKN